MHYVSVQATSADMTHDCMTSMTAGMTVLTVLTMLTTKSELFARGAVPTARKDRVDTRWIRTI